MRSISVIVLASLAVACATTYTQPITSAPRVSLGLSASKADILVAAKKILVSEGFAITSADDVAGVISTTPRNLRVTPEQADCGTTMGLNYLLDKRTSTRVGYGIVAEEGRVMVKATIEAEYKPGDVAQDITLTCVSRGQLESEMLTKIVAGISG
jgi:hypothetical protein